MRLLAQAQEREYVGQVLQSVTPRLGLAPPSSAPGDNGSDPVHGREREASAWSGARRPRALALAAQDDDRLVPRNQYPRPKRPTG